MHDDKPSRMLRLTACCCHVGAAAEDAQALCVELTNHVLPRLESYIWQRDRFSLRVGARERPPWQRGEQDAVLPPTLWGSVAFGDNIEDEWFIVWLLLDITRRFRNLVAR